MNSIGEYIHAAYRLNEGVSTSAGKLSDEFLQKSAEEYRENNYKYDNLADFVKTFYSQYSKADQRAIFAYLLDTGIDNDINESLNLIEGFDRDIYQWLENHYGSSGWKPKFKQYIEKIKNSGYNTTNLEKDIKIAVKQISKKTKVKPQVFMDALKESCTKKPKKKLTEASNEMPYFKAFITNLGKYNEGDLVGEWVQFPIDEDEFDDILRKIGIDGTYEEWFVTDYDCNVSGAADTLGEYTSYDALQNMGEFIESIDDITAVENATEVTGDVLEAIEGLSKGSITFIPGIESEYDLGLYIAENGARISEEDKETYFDYEALGRDLSFDDYFDVLDEDQQEELLAEGKDTYSAGEYFCGDENASDYDIGEEYVAAVGIEGVANSDYYFDYEAFGRDLLAYNFTLTSNGCIMR